VIGLQVLAAIIAASIAAWFAGVHGAISAALGGLISITAGLAFVALAAKSAGKKGNSAGEVLFAALKAEAVKLFLAGLLDENLNVRRTDEGIAELEFVARNDIGRDAARSMGADRRVRRKDERDFQEVKRR